MRNTWIMLLVCAMLALGYVYIYSQHASVGTVRDNFGENWAR